MGGDAYSSFGTPDTLQTNFSFLSKMTANEFLTDIQTLRKRARQHIEKGAVTEGYTADRETVIRILNEALATEIVCVLRYKRHYYMATGIHAQAVAAEFLEHANEEQGHADQIAERITQLGGAPNFNPDGLTSRSHAEYVEGESLVDMIKEDLVAERIAIDSYREMAQYFGGEGPHQPRHDRAHPGHGGETRRRPREPAHDPGPDREGLVHVYAAAREGAAVFALPDRALIAVTGPLRQKFLHNILSNEVQSRTAGQGSRAAVMDVKGHLVAFLRVLVDKDEVLLEVAGGRVAAVESLLVHYRVAAPVRFRRHGSRGRRPGRAAGRRRPPGRRRRGARSRAASRTRWRAIGGAPVRVARAGDLPAGGLRPPRSAGSTRGRALRADRGRARSRWPPRSMDVLRIEDGRPWYGPDVSEENLLHETTLVAEYHSPTKGCYVGQEVIARLEARGGNVNKLLRGLRLAAPGAAGDRIHAAGKDVGRITTAGVSPALGADRHGLRPPQRGGAGHGGARCLPLPRPSRGSR